ncbi:MAG: hypothetical protein PGN13_09940, partial [Patulibacter minatonensis]
MPAIRPLRALVAALIALFIVASPAAAAVSQKAAGKKALSALGVKQGKQPVVVFSVKRALGGGTQLTQAGQAKPPVPGGSLGTKATTAPVLLKVPSGRRAWAFYADWAPYQAYAHRGQLAIVDAATGKVRLSSFLTSPPVIDGRLPEFMRSGKAYRSSASRIFVRDYVVDDTTALTLASRAGFGYRLDRAPFADQALAKLAADQLAADKVCALRVSDTFGDFYDFTGADNTRARLGDLLYVLRKLNPGIVDERYSRGSGKSPIEALRTLITSKGCKDVLFYVAGRGFSSGDGTTVSVGTRVRGRTVTQQLVRAADLLALVKAFPGVNFTVKVDAPALQAVRRPPRGDGQRAPRRERRGRRRELVRLPAVREDHGRQDDHERRQPRRPALLHEPHDRGPPALPHERERGERRRRRAQERHHPVAARRPARPARSSSARSTTSRPPSACRSRSSPRPRSSRPVRRRRRSSARRRRSPTGRRSPRRSRSRRQRTPRPPSRSPSPTRTATRSPSR